MPAELRLRTIDGEERSAEEWTTLFHLLLVVLDPYTDESAWIIDTAGRILEHFSEADCRPAWLVTSRRPGGARQFLGPWAERFLTFHDPDREVVKALGLERLPAMVHLDVDHQIRGSAEGWHPDEWRKVSEQLAKILAWSRPQIPRPGDPLPFDGTPALG